MKSFLLGLWRRLRGTPGSPLRTASAVALGLFVGCQPVYGLHLLLVLAICLPLKLDSVLAYLAANISNPFVAPLLIFGEVETGSLLLTGHFVAFDVAQARGTGAAGFAQQLLVGAVALGAALALVGFAVTWLVAPRRPPGEAAGNDADLYRSALERTRARYGSAPAAERYYVAGKLAFDPVFQLVAELGGSWGRVLDVGCGRGQLGLFLHELGRVSGLWGADSDASKVAVARAAGPEFEFVTGDVAELTLPDADTILLIDVLHYLPRAEQDALLRAALDALSPGGRLLVRELDADPSARSALTRFFEWCARKTGLNRGRATHYRPAADFLRLFADAGVPYRVQDASRHTPFANVLIVAGG